MVCVDMADLLRITLPYNRHHFEEVVVITTPEDRETQKVAEYCTASLHTTRSFYDDGALFNKWKALEQGFDWMGRTGWICVMDCDILWPKDAFPGFLDCGQLCTPLRRMWADYPNPPRWLSGRIGSYPVTPWPVPPESEWSKFPLHPQQHEWAGYTQIFHASDPVLGEPPWHQIDWRHAGGADSFFQAKWDKQAKVRPPFEVLHLGPSGTNWGGRADLYPERAEEVRRLVLKRREATGPDRFRAERLGQ
jgi:hypothetical protein